MRHSAFGANIAFKRHVRRNAHGNDSVTVQGLTRPCNIAEVNTTLLPTHTLADAAVPGSCDTVFGTPEHSREEQTPLSGERSEHSREEKTPLSVDNESFRDQILVSYYRVFLVQSLTNRRINEDYNNCKWFYIHVVINIYAFITLTTDCTLVTVGYIERPFTVNATHEVAIIL